MALKANAISDKELYTNLIPNNSSVNNIILTDQIHSFGKALRCIHSAELSCKFDSASHLLIIILSARCYELSC